MKSIVFRWSLYYLQYSPLWKQLVKIRKQENQKNLFQAQKQKTLTQKSVKFNLSEYFVSIKANNRLKMMTNLYLNSIFFNQSSIKQLIKADIETTDLIYKEKYKIIYQLIEFLDSNIDNLKSQKNVNFLLDIFFQMLKANNPLDFSQKKQNINNNEENQIDQQISDKEYDQLNLRREILSLSNQFCKRVLLNRFSCKLQKEKQFQNLDGQKKSKISYFCKIMKIFISETQKKENQIEIKQQAQTQKQIRSKTFQQRVLINKIKIEEENTQDWISAFQENIDSICLFVIKNLPFRGNFKIHQNKQSFLQVLSFYEIVIKLMRTQSIKYFFKRQYEKIVKLKLLQFSQERRQFLINILQLTQNKELKTQKIVQQLLNQLIFGDQQINKNHLKNKNKSVLNFKSQQKKIMNCCWILKILQKKLIQFQSTNQKNEKINDFMFLLKKIQIHRLSYCQNIIFNQLIVKMQKKLQSQTSEKQHKILYEVIKEIRSIKINLKQRILEKGQNISKNIQQISFEQSLQIMKQINLFQRLNLTKEMFHTQNFKKIFLKILNSMFCNKFLILTINQPQILYLILKTCQNLDISIQQFQSSKKKLKLQNKQSILNILQYKNLIIDLKKHEQIFKGWVIKQSHNGFVWSQQAQKFYKYCQKLIAQ